ncbi:hypothetical protein BH10PSE13_BH10PSE13_20110 [soil metagenome]
METAKLMMERRLALPSARALGRALLAFVRDPLFAFLLAGAAIFLGYYLVELRRQQAIRFTPEAEQAMVEEYEILSGRKASVVDRARMKSEYLTEELLFREAIDRNMHLTDGETRKRLIERVRYLIAGAPMEPTEEQLVDHYSDNLARYRGEPRTSFTQIFRAEKPVDAALLLARLNAGDVLPSDDFWLGRDFPRYGVSMIRGIFGQDVVRALKNAPDGRWVGPVQSARGWHFLRKTESLPAAMMPYPQVRDQVREDYRMAHAKTAIDAAVVRLREKFDVEE